MAYEKIVQTRRTIYVAECTCGEKDVRDDNPPRERQCPKCGAWVKYLEQSYTGPDLGK